MVSTLSGTGAATGDSPRAVARRAIEDAGTALGGRRPDLALVFASPKQPLSLVLAEAEDLLPGTDVVGCSTAGEFTRDGVMHGGVVAMLLSWGEVAHTCTDLVPLDGTSDAEELTWRFAGGVRAFGERHRAAGRGSSLTLVLADGMSARVEQLVRGVRRVTPPEHVVIGGGAGDDGELADTWVGKGDATMRGGAVGVHICSARPWGIGIGQGIAPRSKRMTVTRSTGSVLYELDGAPIHGVYDALAKEDGVELTSGTRMQYYVENLIGIYLFDEIVRVRAGIASTDDGGLVCAGEVPEGSIVSFVRGSVDTFVAAAREAAREAKRQVGGDIAGALVFSCVTRGMIMGDSYDLEARAIAAELDGVPVAGFSSYGEIARVKGKLDGYHNNTVVVVAIPE